MKVTVFYTGHEPEIDKALIQAAGSEPVQVGDQLADNPEVNNPEALARLNFRVPSHVNRHFLSFELDETAGDRFVKTITCPELTIVVSGRKPAVCPTCGNVAEHAHVDQADQDLSHVEDFANLPDPPSPPAPSVEPRFMKVYPCGCTAGPGPENMPDYCPEHGNPDDTAACQTVPFVEPTLEDKK